MPINPHRGWFVCLWICVCLSCMQLGCPSRGSSMAKQFRSKENFLKICKRRCYLQAELCQGRCEQKVQPLCKKRFQRCEALCPMYLPLVQSAVFGRSCRQQKDCLNTPKSGVKNSKASTKRGVLVCHMRRGRCGLPWKSFSCPKVP